MNAVPDPAGVFPVARDRRPATSLVLATCTIVASMLLGANQSGVPVLARGGSQRSPAQPTASRGGESSRPAAAPIRRTVPIGGRRGGG
jgi:hypothetical protein